MSSDSPRSDKVETRFSTPVPELDDHRFQLHSIPRLDGMAQEHVRRSAARTDSDDNAQLHKVLGESGLVSRDFEHEQAIVDDDRSIKNEIFAPRRTRGSISPTMLRRPTNRPSRNQHDRPLRSRTSSSSSTSPPNSVEAFADPRRRERANTLESKIPSDLDIVRNRSDTLGDGQHHPPTTPASIARETRKGEDEGVVEDVCFPSYEEPGKTYTIDYEELEEFVALAKDTPLQELHRNVRKQSMSSMTRAPRIFHDLRRSKGNPNPPQDPHRQTEADRSSVNQTMSTDHVKKSSEVELDEKIPLEPFPPISKEPERYVFFSSETTNTVHATDLADLIGDGVSFRDLFELGPDGGVAWLDIENPTYEEYGALARAFHIHPLTSEDIMTQEAREKVELFPNYYFVCFRTFYQMDKTSEEYLEPVNIYIVVFRECVLSFSFSDQPHAKSVRKRIGRLRDYVSLGSDWICYAMIDDIVDSFGPVIRDAELESEAIEDQVFITREDDYASLLKQIGLSRKRVLNLMRLLGGKADVIKGFAKRCNEQYSITPRGDIGLYLGDIQDHVVTMMSNLGHVEKMLSRSHGNYLAQLNVDGVMRGHEANRVLAKITLIATVLVPLNLITGLFGMNVPVPGKNSSSLAWFFGIIGVIAMFVLVSLGVAKKMRYI